jgi:GNAT superfamily N-acetyltransferase
MPDMLVKLYGLPELEPFLLAAKQAGARVRPAAAYEKAQVIDWVTAHFGTGWAGECEAAFARQPVACWIATEAGGLAGFACHEATSRGFFGPIGVLESRRGTGIGKALLLGCLHSMKAIGYSYAIVGGVDETTEQFYRNAAGAGMIDGSDPGIYVDRLKSVP